MNIPMERHDEPLRSRGPRPMPMALIACVLSASPFALPPVAGAQATGVTAVPPLIVFGQERSLDAGGSAPGLTHEQAATLEAIRTDPLVSELHVGRSEAAALAAVPVARALSIPVPGSARGAFVFTGVDVVHNAEGMVSLHARKEANDTSVSLVVQGADVLGSIEHGDGTWRVAPLGGGLTAVYRYDTSGLRMDPPGWGMRQRLLAPEPRPMDDAGASVEEADSGDTIDLMVVYTPAAAALGNIDAFIQFALNNTHDAYRNSNIGFRLRLVHKAQVDYTQHASNMGEDLQRLSNLNRNGRPVANDGYMDEVHDLRDRYGADLVALLVARPASRVCGVAWIPPFGRYPRDDFESLGFSVNARSCETTSGRVFAHELGHNQGARHDPYNSPGDCPTGPDSCDGQGNFPWRYGRCNTEQGWRTVMAYRSTPDGRCVQSTARFSSPDVTWGGRDRGRGPARQPPGAAGDGAACRQLPTVEDGAAPATTPAEQPPRHPALRRPGRRRAPLLPGAGAQRLGAAEHGAGDGLRRHRAAFRSGAAVHRRARGRDAHLRRPGVGRVRVRGPRRRGGLVAPGAQR